jgi:serine protease
MKLKTFVGSLVVVAILFLALGAVMVSASGGGPKEYSSLGKAQAAFVPDEIVVKFKGDAKPFRVIKVPPGQVKAKVTEYSQKPGVVYAEPNYIAYALSMPNDPLFNLQWHFGPTAYGGIGTEQAWDVSTGNGVIVAIVDTGIAYENFGSYALAPDLAQTAFVPGYDFINNDAHPNDDNSHGTHVAGTVAQSTNNGVGVAGVAYGAKLMPIKVLGKDGSGSYTAIANGIRYAADNGAKVINLSLGGSSGSETLRSALEYAYAKGVTIVAAAGNNGSSKVSYPAAYDAYVIAVGATRYDKNLAAYSNYGPSLDVVAPGGDTSVDQNGDGYGDGVLQNTFNPSTKKVSDFGYWFFQGTSMASPHVAAVAALVIAKGTATSPSDVRSAIQETAVDLGAQDRDDRYGWGLVDAYAALNWGGATPNTPPVADPQSVTTNEDAAVGITLTATDAENDALTYAATSPSHGTLTGTAPNLTYTPAANYHGADSFTFTAYDGKAYSEAATVSITIASVNDAPTANPQSVTTPMNTAVAITLTGSDVDGDALAYAATSPSHGTLTGTAPNLTYTPAANYHGADSFTFTVNDGNLTSASATVTITVYDPAALKMHVANITMELKKSGVNTWATATVTIVDSSGHPVQGAQVTGKWSGATTDTDTALTNSSGQVTVESNKLRKPRSGTTFTFTVTGVVLSGWTYDYAANVETSAFIQVP